MIPGTAGSSAVEPARQYDTGLFDLDGVVYIGADPVPSAVEALRGARAAGMRVAFVTNNASRTPAAVAGQLTRLGVPAVAGDVVTSAQACARLVAERVPAGSAVLVCGGIGLRQALREHGLRPVSTAEEAPAAVVQGYVRGIEHGLLAEGALAVERGALFVGANADATLPTARGPVPGNGALLRVIATATGREPLVAGKPEPPLHREAMLRTGARRPLVVGDRLDTDIEGATNGGVDSMLVLTGVTHPADVVSAPPKWRPSLIAADLGGLLVPHPRVDGGEGVATCREWRAAYVDGRLDVTGAGDAYDGLRALCGAAWSAAEAVGGAAAREAVRKVGL
ncbi:MAG TPA: HAD-IIA family hydrolase [Streptosporangiaceae bacterium]|jgi:HAD superfamily hydrolase (TIGR01450 family)